MEQSPPAPYLALKQQNKKSKWQRRNKNFLKEKKEKELGHKLKK